MVIPLNIILSKHVLFNQKSIFFSLFFFDGSRRNSSRSFYAKTRETHSEHLYLHRVKNNKISSWSKSFFILRCFPSLISQKHCFGYQQKHVEKREAINLLFYLCCKL